MKPGFPATLEGSFLRSAGRGATWSAPLDSTRSGHVFDILAEGESVLVGADSGVFVSRDRGVHWAAYDHAGLPARVPVFALLAQDDTLFAAFDKEGCWKRALAEIGPTSLKPRQPSPPSLRPAPFRSGPGRMGFPRREGSLGGSCDAGGKRLP